MASGSTRRAMGDTAIPIAPGRATGAIGSSTRIRRRSCAASSASMSKAARRAPSRSALIAMASRVRVATPGAGRHRDAAAGIRVLHISRRNAESDWRIVNVPELRILPQELWEAAKRRQQALDAKLEGKRDPGRNRRSGITATRRPAHLLSGLIRCGVCGGGMSLVGGTSYGCSTARDKGTCGNRRTIKRRDIEAIVLEGLKEQLMAPEAVKEFVAEFHREINRLTAERRAEAEAGRREIDKIEREIRAIVDAIKAGGFSGALQREHAALEARHAQLAAQAAAPVPAPVAIHPNASEIYRRKVAQLHDALTAEDTRAGAAEALRALIDAICIVPEGEGNAVEIVGELGALLQLAYNNKNAASIGEAARSIKLVARPATTDS